MKFQVRHGKESAGMMMSMEVRNPEAYACIKGDNIIVGCEQEYESPDGFPYSNQLQIYLTVDQAMSLRNDLTTMLRAMSHRDRKAMDGADATNDG